MATSGFSLGTTITWQDTGGDHNIDAKNLSDQVAKGELHDWGAVGDASRTFWYLLGVHTTIGESPHQTTPQFGDPVQVGIHTAGFGSSPGQSNDDETAGTFLSAFSKSLNYSPSIVTVFAEDAGAPFLAVEKAFFCPARHFGPYMAYRSAVQLRNVNNVWIVQITPLIRSVS